MNLNPKLVEFTASVYGPRSRAARAVIQAERIRRIGRAPHFEMVRGEIRVRSQIRTVPVEQSM